jgi:hypothetical protein
MGTPGARAIRKRIPEHLTISDDPEAYLRAKLAAWSAGGHPFDETAIEQCVTRSSSGSRMSPASSVSLP